jgi:KilA domain-containing protein
VLAKIEFAHFYILFQKSMETTSFISRAFDTHNIRQRERDGYVSATDMCKVSDKKMNHYIDQKSTNEYLKELETDTGIPVSVLIEIHKGGNAYLNTQGTWVHPMVAMHLAQWISPKFAIQVSKWVLRYLSGDLTLIPEVMKQHDAVHDTTTTALVSTVDNEVIRRQKTLELDQLEVSNKRQLEEIEQMKTQTAREKNALIIEVNGNALLKQDAHLYTALRMSIINTLGIHQDIAPENNIINCRDVSELIKSLGHPVQKMPILSQIGKLIKKEWNARYPGIPIARSKKHVAGGIRWTNVYPPIDEPWIIEIIHRRLA